MCTLPTENECNRISASMRRIIKHAARFAISLPSAFLHANTGINMTNLYQRNIQNHISSFLKRFNSSPRLTNIYLNRLLSLQDALLISFPPFLIKNFSAWLYTVVPLYSHPLYKHTLFLVTL